MEQNLPIIAKKFWNIVRVVYFMLRKSISKAKLLADLNMILMMKRGKIKSAIHNLIHHHHHHHSSASSATISAAVPSEPQLSFSIPKDAYEFSCSNTPAHHHSTFRLPFHLKKRKHSHAAMPVAVQLSDGELWAAAMEIVSSVAPSPALPGFGRTPMVRQLKVTDSPFPVTEIEEDNHVDEACEEFINRFRRGLRIQNSMASPSLN